jgi:hypothetical protein
MRPAFSSTAGAVPGGPCGQPRMRWPMLEPGKNLHVRFRGAGRAVRRARLPDTVVQPSSVIGLHGSRSPSWHRRYGWSSGRGHSSVRGRRVRPPRVRDRQGPGASISEAAWWSSQRARPVTTEGSSMSPSPCVRFRRSGTRDFAEAGERLFCGPWSRDNCGRRFDGGASASGREGVVRSLRHRSGAPRAFR